MKISKLFHWLYAFLMFLPIVLFIPNAFYYGFNEHATNSETTTITYKYQSNEVNSLDDLVEGNIYQCDTFNLVLANIENDLEITIYSYDETSNVVWYNYQGLDEVASDSEYHNNNGNEIHLHVDNGEMYVYFTNSYLYASVIYNVFDYQFVNIVFSVNNNLEYFKDYLNASGSDMPQYTDYNVIESVEINNNDTISNKMFQAWQSTWNLPLLQWTHTSFVAQPFTYITGLFGVPSDSTLNYIFAYFVSISICWLVFDLLMYVPNLAHRWLDRSALE